MVEKSTRSPVSVAAPTSPKKRGHHSYSPIPTSCIVSFSSHTPVFTLGDDGEIVEFEPTATRGGVNMNMVYYIPLECLKNLFEVFRF